MNRMEWSRFASGSVTPRRDRRAEKVDEMQGRLVRALTDPPTKAGKASAFAAAISACWDSPHMSIYEAVVREHLPSDMTDSFTGFVNQSFCAARKNSLGSEREFSMLGMTRYLEKNLGSSTPDLPFNIESIFSQKYVYEDRLPRRYMPLFNAGMIPDLGSDLLFAVRRTELELRMGRADYEVFAISLEDGRKCWSLSLPAISGFSIRVTSAGVCVLYHGVLQMYDKDLGRLLWQIETGFVSSIKCIESLQGSVLVIFEGVSGAEKDCVFMIPEGNDKVYQLFPEDPQADYGRCIPLGKIGEALGCFIQKEEAGPWFYVLFSSQGKILESEVPSYHAINKISAVIDGQWLFFDHLIEGKAHLAVLDMQTGKCERHLPLGEPLSGEPLLIEVQEPFEVADGITEEVPCRYLYLLYGSKIGRIAFSNLMDEGRPRKDDLNVWDIHGDFDLCDIESGGEIKAEEFGASSRPYFGWVQDSERGHLLMERADALVEYCPQDRCLTEYPLKEAEIFVTQLPDKSLLIASSDEARSPCKVPSAPQSPKEVQQPRDVRMPQGWV